MAPGQTIDSWARFMTVIRVFWQPRMEDFGVELVKVASIEDRPQAMTEAIQR